MTRCTSAPIHVIPDPSLRFQIFSDASGKGLGCVFMQNQQVVAYASRQLKTHKGKGTWTRVSASTALDDSAAIAFDVFSVTSFGISTASGMGSVGIVSFYTSTSASIEALVPMSLTSSTLPVGIPSSIEGSDVEGWSSTIGWTLVWSEGKSSTSEIIEVEACM